VVDVYPILGKVVAVVGHDTMVLQLDEASKWVSFGHAEVMALFMQAEDPAVPPVRVQTRCITRAATGAVPPCVPPGAAVIHVVHTEQAVWADTGDDEALDMRDDGDAAAQYDVHDVEEALQVARNVGTRVVLRGCVTEAGRPIKPICDQSAAEVIETLNEFVLAWTSYPDRDPVSHFHILDTGLVMDDGTGGLSDHSRPEELDDAARVLFSLLAAMEAHGRVKEVFGDATGAAIARSTDLKRTLARVVLAYHTARFAVELHASRAADHDVTQRYYGGLTVVDVDQASSGKPESDEVVFMKMLYTHTGSQCLRHVDNVVYAQQCVPKALDVTWRHAACTAQGCSVVGPGVMYSAEGQPPGTVWCLDHAAQAIEAGIGPVVNVVFQTAATWGAGPELRHATGAAPRFLQPTQPSTTRTRTRTWVPDMSLSRGDEIGGAIKPRTVDDLLQDVLCNRSCNYALWARFIGRPGISTHLSLMMRKSRDPLFPAHAPKATLIAFVNGVYSFAENRFFEFHMLPPEWAEMGALNFVPEFFDPLWTVQPLEELKVGGYDDILETQGYDEATRAFLDAFLGRMLFPLNSREQWQRALVLLGVGGTGKSSLARAIMLLVREHNVGILASNLEESFGLASLTGKVCVICTEMKQDFKLPNSDLQLMIVGDPITVRVKNQTAFDVSPWVTPTMLVGNVLPNAWRGDEGAPMERRAIVIRADVKPSTQDPSVQGRFFANLGVFLVRIVRQYLALVARVADAAPRRQLNSFFPKQVRDFQAMFKSETSTATILADHLQSFFEVGFAQDGGPLNIAGDESLVALFRHLADSRDRDGNPRYPQLAFNIAQVKEAVAQVVVEEVFAGDSAEEYAKVMRVPLRDIDAIYRAWWKETNSTSGRKQAVMPSIVSILSEMGLPYSVDVMGESKSDRWVFGLSRKRGGGGGGGNGGGSGGGGGGAGGDGVAAGGSAYY
jgi:hypothetical protein